jgi:PAS domain S-box-containing protein
MESRWMPWPEAAESAAGHGWRGRLIRYGVAVLLAVAALFARILLRPLIHDEAPYLTFFVAILSAAAYGGFGPGLAATAVGAVLANRFVRPGESFLGYVDPTDPLGVLRIVFFGLLTSYICGLLVASNTRAREAQHSERRQRLLFQQTLVSIADAVISTDTVGRIQLMNAAAEKLTGATTRDAAGQRLDAVLKLEGAQPTALLGNVVRTSVAVPLPSPAIMKSPAGPITIEGTASPVIDENGILAGAVISFRDITERRKAETQLAEQADELRRSNRELEEFGYVVSHDLQEPLRTVNSYSELLLRRMGPQSGELEQIAGVIRYGIDRMNRLIQDLLAYSRVAHEPESAAMVDPQRCVDDALAVCGPLISEAAADVIVGELPPVLAGHSHLSQVFQNLISNAVKYRKPGAQPHIRVNAREQDGEVLFSVADDGIGFDARYASRIFGLFKRLHTDEYPGTGVGLAITQKIIERYHGRIWAEGVRDGGATFWFTLPSARSRQPRRD